MTRLCNLSAALLFSVGAVLAGEGDRSLEHAAADAAAAVLRPGAEGVALTVLEGNAIREIPLKYLGTYDDFGGPGYDLHLVELEGPDAERVGIANGMSGSPVYLEGQLIGALSYRLGLIPKTAVAGVTPLSNMLAADRALGLPRPRPVSGLVPIATPVLVGGMPAGVRQWLAPELDALGFVLVPGGGGSAPAAELKPGSPVGVELVRGDMRIAATGTVTWVDGDRVYAFGHPFLGIGRVEMPMVAAEVIHTLADLAGSMKLANVGAELGAIVEDREGAIVGRLGQTARMIPFDLIVRGADYGEQSFHYEMIPHARLAPLLAGAVIGSSLQGVGYSQDTTMLARGRVRLRGRPDLPLEMSFASGGGTDPTMAIATEVLMTLTNLGLNPFDELEIEGLTLEIDAHLGATSYQVEEVQYSRRELEPGAPLRIRCILRKYRGGTVAHELELALPERLADDDGLMLVVGSPMQVERALGDPLTARLRSAVDLDSVVRIFLERRAAHRLTAVIYRSGGALVSRGGAYSELPLTAERLLATQAASRSSPRSSFVSPLARSDVELDGPIRGGVQVRLRVDRREAEGSGGVD